MRRRRDAGLQGEDEALAVQRDEGAEAEEEAGQAVRGDGGEGRARRGVFDPLDLRGRLEVV